MTVEELIRQAAKEVVAEQMQANPQVASEPVPEIEVAETSAEQLTSSAKSGC